MRKIMLITVLALALGSISPVMQHAHAASMLDQILDQAASRDFKGVNAHDLARVKQDLANGNKEDIIGMIAQNAAQRISKNSEVANLLGSEDKGNWVTSTLKQQAVGKIADKFGIPQDGVNAIVKLLSNLSLNPKVAQENNSLEGSPANYHKVLNMTATAYGPGRSDNGKWGNMTYLGGTVRKGVVAVDPGVIPLGSKVWVEGYGPAVAEDEGSSISGNHIDLAFNTRPEALEYGEKQVKVYVL